MTTSPHNLRIQQSGGFYQVQQAFIVARQGRSDDYPDQLADTEEIGSEQWSFVGEFVDLNEALLLAFEMMLEGNLDLRTLDTSLLTPQEVSRALTQINQFVVT